MANDKHHLSTYQLLATGYTDIETIPSGSNRKKNHSWRHWLSWNGFFKGLAITLLVGGAIAIGYGLITTLWPISIPLALFVTGAAVSIWTIGTYKGFFNTMAKWGTALDGHDKPLNTIENTIKDIHKLIKRVNQELAQLHEHEQSNSIFLDLTQKLAKQDPVAASQLRTIYLQSAKQQLNKYKNFSKIVKEVKRVYPKLANKLYDIYVKDNSLLQQASLIKAQQCYQLLAHKNKPLAKQLAKLYIDNQQRENEINSHFQKFCTTLQKQQPKLANKIRKFSRKEHNQTSSKGYFKAFPCQIKRTWTHSLLKEISAKQAYLAKLLKKVEVHDQSNQERYDEYTHELAKSMQTVNNFYPQLHMLSTAYQTFKTALKDIVCHPTQQSFKQLGKAIKAHSPFKKHPKSTERHSRNEVAEVGSMDTAVAYTGTLDNHGLFAKPVIQEEEQMINNTVSPTAATTPIFNKTNPEAKKTVKKTEPSAFLSLNT